MRIFFQETLSRRLFLFFTHIISRTLIALFCLCGGIAYGCTSHTIPFEVDNQRDYILLWDSDHNDYYLQIPNSPTYFEIETKDFTPQVDRLSFTQNHAVLSRLVYANQPQATHFKSSNGQTIDGTVYPVVHFSFTNYESQQLLGYSTAAYEEQSTGIPVNHWPLAILMVMTGLIFWIFAYGTAIFDLPRLRTLPNRPSQDALSISILAHTQGESPSQPIAETQIDRQATQVLSSSSIPEIQIEMLDTQALPPQINSETQIETQETQALPPQPIPEIQIDKQETQTLPPLS